ncbi:MAG: hypothetical protein HQL28_04565 [Candidatus Omnitrophica bacterium]|nr:hypothetical protein [Candidatus Omnitrophota bacterium]
MNKMKLLKLVNLLLITSFLVQGATIIVMLFHIKFPHVQVVFKTHVNNGLVLVCLALTHITLNWSWIRTTYLTKASK